MKLKIQQKLILYITSTALIVILAVVLYIGYNTKDQIKSATQTVLQESVTNTALKIESAISSEISALRSLATSLSATNTLTEQQRIEIYRAAINTFLENNPTFNNIKISWEMHYLTPEWQKSFGRQVYTFERGDGSIRHTITQENMLGDDFSSAYYKVKVNIKEMFTQITNDDPENTYLNPIYKSTVYIPITDSEDNFCAFVSADINVETFNNMVKRNVRYESFASVLLNDLGQVAGSSQNMYDKQSDIIKLIHQSSYDIRTKIDSSGFCFYTLSDSTGLNLSICAVGVDNNMFDHKWTFVSAISQNKISANYNTKIIIVISIIFIGLIIISIVVWLFTSKLGTFLTKAGYILNRLSVGNFTSLPDIESNQLSELNNIAQSLNQLKTGLGRAVNFAEEIGKGDLNAQYEPMSKTDELGLSLLSMRNSLKTASQEDAKRKEMDSKQNWITIGTAKFGDILRQYNNDMGDFSFNIISNIVKYIGANQGGLFVINNDDKDDVYFELTAGYAYNIRKMLKKKVKPGVGLVGRCILEGESVYINNLPEDYINITSGLGEKSPNCLLIVPFKFNNEIYAVAEIAAFDEIDNYKQQFVEEVGHSIASTIATVKINVRTNKLLKELKVQSEELASQEEEMRQNMDAMKASQEAMAKQVEEYEQTNECINQLVIITTYNLDGKLTDANTKAVELFQKPKDELLESNEPLYTVITESEHTDTDEFWVQLRIGRQKIVQKEIKINDIHYLIEETYTPVQNYYGKINKVICVVTKLNKKTNTETTINDII